MRELSKRKKFGRNIIMIGLIVSAIVIYTAVVNFSQSTLPITAKDVDVKITVSHFSSANDFLSICKIIQPDDNLLKEMIKVHISWNLLGESTSEPDPPIIVFVPYGEWTFFWGDYSKFQRAGFNYPKLHDLLNDVDEAELIFKQEQAFYVTSFNQNELTLIFQNLKDSTKPFNFYFVYYDRNRNDGWVMPLVGTID